VGGPITLIQAIAMARGTTEDANARRVAVFRTIGGKRQAAAFDLTAIRRGESPDPQIYPGDIVVVDGSRVKSVQKQILQSIPLLAIFGPL
jgi:polysaccharide export outer membrane protein